MTVNGGLGDDRFVVFHNQAVLSLNGDDGDDEFEVRAFALVGSQEPERGRTDITGGAGADLVEYAVNAPVNINGGDGFDTLIVVGTEFGDDFVITKDGVYGAGLTVNFVDIESLRVDGAEGDDRFFLKSTSEKFTTELFGGLGSDTFNMSGDTPPVVSNDLLGHSGLVLHSLESVDPLFTGQKLFGVSANVADNEEPFAVIRESGGSTIITEGNGVAAVSDSYQVVLTRRPDTAVFIQALAPLPPADRREKRQLDFRMSSPTGVAKEDGSAVTLTFTPQNWFVPQTVELQADDVIVNDTGQLFTRPELDNNLAFSNPMFSYNDASYEGETTAVINHVVQAGGQSLQGLPLALTPFAKVVIPNTLNKSFDEFLGRTLAIATGSGAGQQRLITGARLIDGNMHLTLDRSWWVDALPNTASTFEVQDSSGAVQQSGTPVSVTNPTVTIAATDINFSLDELLGRKVEIISGKGAGQSRYITGAVLEIDKTLSQVETTVPSSFTFDFDVSKLTPSGDGLLTIDATGDLNSGFENFAVDAEGTSLGNVFATTIPGADAFSTTVQTTIDLSQALLTTLVSDGTIRFTLTPSSQVDSYAPTRLALRLQFPSSAADSVDGEINLTLDRGWPDIEVPTTASEYLVRIDDAFVGSMTSFDESPSGLPATTDPDDQRTTFTDYDAEFPTSAQGLRGSSLQIVGGPGAGQQRLILNNLPSDPTRTLILNGPWRTDPVAGQSLYRIERYDGLAIPSVEVQINDDDLPGLIIDETQGVDNPSGSITTGDIVADYDTITAVIEGGDGNHLGEQDVLRSSGSRRIQARMSSCS